MANIPHEPTEENRNIVMRMKAAGFKNMDVCRVLGVSLNTLLKYYKHEVECGKAIVAEKITSGILAKALSGDMTAMIFYARTQLGWAHAVAPGSDLRGDEDSPATESELVREMREAQNRLVDMRTTGGGTVAPTIEGSVADDDGD